MRQMLAFIIALIALATCGAHAEEVPGVTETNIRVGMITDLTGPLAFLGQEISAGAQLYLRHVNEQGGVHGRTLELLVEDDGYQPPRTIAAFRKLVDRDGIFCFVGNMGSTTTMATFPFIERERIPLIMPGTYNSAIYQPPKRYVFAADPSYSVQSWIMVKYILEVEKTEAPRLAVVYQDDDYGHDGLSGLREAAAYYGVPLVAEVSYKRGAVDFGTQLLNLKQADPTHVILWTVYREGAAVMREAYTSDWHPRFVGPSVIADDKIVALSGEAAADFSTLSLFDLNSDSTTANPYLELLEKYDPDREIGAYHSGGVYYAQVLVEGLQRAGRDITREKLVEAMESFSGWTSGFGPPVTYGPNVRGGVSTAAFVMKADVAQKKLLPVTDWIQFERPRQLAEDR